MEKNTEKIFYLEKHVSCFNYKTPINEGFTQHDLLENSFLEHVMEREAILFILKGNLYLTCRGKRMRLTKKHMIFLSRNDSIVIETYSDCKVMVAQFEKLISPCTKYHFTQMNQLKKQLHYKFKAIEIKHPLILFLRGMQTYLDMGINCFHIHELKLKELFWLLRFYYSDIELASFLYNLLGNKGEEDMRLVVLDNWLNVKSIKELASLCNLSQSTFRRRFQQEFGESIGVWIQRNKKEIVMQKLTDPALTLSQISEQLNFSSPAHLTNYCQRTFGKSPSEIRNKITTPDE